MINQPVAEVIALLGWDDFPKLHLHFFRILYSIYKSYTVAKAYAEFTREVIQCGEKQRNKYESSLSR